MADIVTVDKDDFPVISEKHEYGIRGNFYNQIYNGLAKYVDVNLEQ